MSDNEERRNKIRNFENKALQTNHSLWSTIITFNGILLGILSILVSTNRISSLFIIIVFLLIIFSVLLSIINFVTFIDSINLIIGDLVVRYNWQDKYPHYAKYASKTNENKNLKSPTTIIKIGFKEWLSIIFSICNVIILFFHFLDCPLHCFWKK